MSAARTARMNDPRPATQPLATLEPVRFGEFLLHRNLISDEQWLAALAVHWSASGLKRQSIGTTIVAQGFLASEIVEREARAFHDDIEVVEIELSSERTTLPSIPVPSARA
jgi:hypothetical protein